MIKQLAKNKVLQQFGGVAINLSAVGLYTWLLVFSFQQANWIGWTVLGGMYAMNLTAIIHTQLVNKRSDRLSKGAWLAVQLVPGYGAHLHFTFAFIPFWFRRRFKKSYELESVLFTDNKVRNNSKITPLFNGDVKYPILFEELKNAKKTIHMSYFIISGGIIYNQLEKILLQKKEEGVEIIILTDYVGNLATINDTYAKLKEAGIKFKFFNQSYPPFNTGRPGHRNHNKIVVVDNKIAFFGGINIGDEYAHMYPKYGFWYDIQYKVEGELVDQLQRRFILDWEQATDDILEVPEANYDKVEGYETNMLFDHPFQEETVWLNKMIERIDDARKEIKIFTPYLIPPYKLTKSLTDAVSRGVEVVIIVPGRADKASAHAGTFFYAERMNTLGVKILVTDDTFLHAKAYMIDDEYTMIGSTNMDYRAIFHHYETNVEVFSKEFNQKISEYFKRVSKNSYIHEKKSTSWGVNRYLWFLIYKMITPAM